MSHKKGPAYERSICKELSIWWSSGTRDDIFWRTAGSGSRATTRAKQKKRTADSYGDIMSSHEMGKTLTKNYVGSLKRGYTGKKNKKSFRTIDLLDVIDRDNSKYKTRPALFKWYRELIRDVRNGKRKGGFIIFKRDFRESIIMMPRELFEALCKMKKCQLPLYSPGCWLHIKGLNVQLMKLKDFFYWCEPQMLGAPRIIRRRNVKLLKGYIKPGPDVANQSEYYKALGHKKWLKKRRPIK